MSVIGGNIISRRDERLKTVVKAADEIVSNSNVLQDDDELLVALEAESVYHFLLVMRGISTVGADWRVCMTAPAATVGAVTWLVTGAVSNTPFGTGTTPAANGTSQVIIGTGIAHTGGSAGDLTFQWAQSTAEVSDTTVYEGSYLILTKVN